MASLSSAEGDVISWEFRVEPHVATKPSKQLPRNNSYSSFADDESSDSSGSRSSGYSVRGSFPSTERLRISWAVPKKVEDVPLTIDGRSRVGIRDVRSDMTCSVLRRNKGKARGRKDSGEDGIVMRVDYTATCRGVWFPGVATLLGMDLALEAEDCDVSWAPGEDNYWTIVGSAGYTGFSVGPQPKASASRKATEDGASTRVSTSPEKRRDYLAPTRLSTAEPASLSTASLLRAPLPSSPHPDELSFDESPNGTPVSSIGSLATMPSDPERGRSRASSAAREGRPTDSEPEDVVQQRPPKVPITIHLNMNELGPASQNEITIKVIGTIVLRPRESNAATFLASPISSGSTGSDDEQEQSSAVMPIPQFHVLFTEQETISNIVLNESDMLSVDIYNSTGNITDAQSRKTVLQPGGKTKCGSDGGRFALRNASSNRSFLRRQDSTENMRRPASRSRPPSYIQRNASTASFYRERSYSINARSKRDGPLMIPSVSTTVTPLSRKGRLPTEYAVRIQLPAPSGADSEWLEFGLALPEQPAAGGPESAKAASGTEKKRRPPMVEVASASVGGVSVQFETSVAARPDSKLPALGLTFEETSAKEWITWVKIHVGDAGGGNVEIVYVVEDQSLAATPSHTGWKFGAASRPRDEVRLNILLPTFFLPVGLMEVNVESLPSALIFPFDDVLLLMLYTEVECDIISNLDHQQTTSTGSKLLKYSLEEFFYPNLTLTMSSNPASKTSSASSGWRMIGLILCMMPTAMALLAMAEKQAISAGLAQAHESLESCSIALQSPPSLPDPVTIMTTATTTATTTNFVTTTVTSTVYTPSSTQAKWRNKQNSVVNEESRTASTSLTSRQSPINSLPTSILVPTSTTVLPPPSLPLPTSSDETEMADVRDMTFLWPTHLDLPALEIPETARVTISKIWNGVGFVWHLFQKVLHYPLDPP